ncbi:uncharacterized protein [Apostichopus japonicus]|uniref:uncharacterized protein isoform X5 n=1 Tax=Stichopus japonicus TaxID=307972 RepID=UPI003AB3D7AD
MENKVNGTVKEVFKLYTLQSNMTKLKERDEAIMKEKNVNLELHKKITTALGNDKVKNTIAEVKLRQKEEEIKREKNENVNLQDTLRRKEDEIKREKSETNKLREESAKKEHQLKELCQDSGGPL